MREILFRGKRKDNGEWIEGDFLQDKDLEKCYIEYFDYYSSENGPQRDYCQDEVVADTVGQYTGLTDKNGKKIFEGDILITGTRMGYILFEKGCFRFRWKNFDKYRDDFFKTCIITEYGSFRELEVIGNIHDNPELLKGGEG